MIVARKVYLLQGSAIVNGWPMAPSLLIACGEMALIQSLAIRCLTTNSTFSLEPQHFYRYHLREHRPFAVGRYLCFQNWIVLSS